MALHSDPDATRDEVREAETLLQGTLKRRRQIFGPAHPKTVWCEEELSGVRELASWIARPPVALT